MSGLTRHVGTVVPLPHTSVDTDAIVPARYCLTTERTGFQGALFARWRSGGGFVLDEPARQGATVLVAGADFGTGSSREHAVWALQDWGFRVVISARFGDIFADNCANAGLAPVVLDDGAVAELLAASTEDAALPVTVDIENRRVEWSTSGTPRAAPMEMDDSLRYRLLHGLDAIAVTLEHEAAIADHERAHPDRPPRRRRPLLTLASPC